MAMPAKLSLNSDDALNEQLDKLSSAVIQTYRAVQAFKDGRYKKPNFKFDPKKEIYPVVVTLESWYLFGKPIRMLSEIVEKKMELASLPVDWLNEMPFIVCNISELEKLAQLIKIRGSIKEVLGNKGKEETKYWELYTYLHDKFKEDVSQIKPLFEEEFSTIFPRSI